MINIPVDIDISLSTEGLEVYASSGDYVSDQTLYSWVTLVNELVEAHRIPNHRGKILVSADDYDRLVEILQDMQGAITHFGNYLAKAEVV